MARVRITVFGAQVIREALRLSTPKRKQIAEEIVGEAEANAPVLTGKYKSSFAVEANGDDVRAVNNADDASYITFGTSDTPPHPGFIDAARKHGKYSGWQPKGRRRS